MKLASKARMTQGERNYLNNCGDLRKPTSMDWAERTARRVFAVGVRDSYAAVVRALRAERRRAVRECHRLGKHGKHLKGNEMCAMYIEACDDCATAIAGGK